MRQPSNRIVLVIMLLAWLPRVGQAAEDTSELDPVEVTAPGIPRTGLNTPAAVSVVDAMELQRGRQRLALDEALNRVPGLFFQNRYNFAQNLRLSIRGFGARAPFGVRGIRLRVDGIPETLPDGQSQVDTIDLETAERVEVLRGPSSALYGNAAGGVLAVETRNAPPNPYVQGRFSGGSYGFRRTGVMGGHQYGPWNAHISTWHMNYDGYRDQSETEKMMFNTKVRYHFGAGRELTTVFTAYDQPRGEDPGGLTRAEVSADRDQAAPFARQLDTHQSVRQQRIGWIYHDEQSLPGELRLASFYTHRDFQQQLPFPGPSRLGYDRAFFGASAEYRDEAALGTMPIDWILGTAFRQQRDDRERFLVDSAGNRGTQIQDALEKGTSSALYGQVEFLPTDELRFRLGGRYDHVRLAIDDRRGQGQASGSRSYDEFSISMGPLWRFHADHRWYANVGTAFETPTFTEFYDPTSPNEGFDPDLEPQTAVNLETGLKGRPTPRTRYSLALFRVRTRDEIVLVSGSPDRFANAGETRRDGVELSLEHRFGNGVSLTGAYTAADYRFRDDGADISADLKGNRLPGLPEHQLFLEAAWRHGGWFASVDGLGISEVYADDANTEEVAGYAVVNTRLAYTFLLADHELELAGGINNLLDKDYFSNVRVNAPNDRYFEPAPGRNVHASLRLRW